MQPFIRVRKGLCKLGSSSVLPVFCVQQSANNQHCHWSMPTQPPEHPQHCYLQVQHKNSHSNFMAHDNMTTAKYVGTDFKCDVAKLFIVSHIR